MAGFIITYDFNRELNDADRKKCREAIKEFPFVKLSESSYAVQYSGTAYALCEHVRKSLDSNDYLYVIPLSKPYAGFGPITTNEWLNTVL